MTRSFRRLLLSLAALLVLVARLGAQVGRDADFPQKPEPLQPVNDYAHVLSAAEAAQLTEKLTRYDRESSTSIIVVTIPSIGSYEVAQYATELGNRWKVGRSGKNNGVVILAAIQEKRVNISVGRGLEGALTDAQSGRIIRNEIAPAFKAGNYAEGFSRAADAVIAATKGEYKADPEEEKGSGGSVIPIIVLVVILLVLFSRRGGGGGGSYMSGRGGRSWVPPVIFGGMGGFGGGGGGWSGGGGGGSFGGSGGGSFGGGGASGSW